MKVLASDQDNHELPARAFSRGKGLQKEPTSAVHLVNLCAHTPNCDSSLPSAIGNTLTV